MSRDSSDMILLGCAALSPLVCWLWHAAREQCWPGFSGGQAGRNAAAAAWMMFGLQGVIVMAQTASIALVLTLPLAALTLASPVYLALYPVWPRVAARAALGMALAGTGLMLTGILIT